MNLYLFKDEYNLLVETFKFLDAEGSRPDLASALLKTINRLYKKMEKQDERTHRKVKQERVVDPDKTLKQLLIESGYPESEMDHHQSDLYIYVTPETTKVVNDWCNTHGYNRNHECPVFADQITGRAMYECAFQWYGEEGEQ
jgi:hypothetical protein